MIQASFGSQPIITLFYSSNTEASLMYSHRYWNGTRFSFPEDWSHWSTPKITLLGKQPNKDQNVDVSIVLQFFDLPVEDPAVKHLKKIKRELEGFGFDQPDNIRNAYGRDQSIKNQLSAHGFIG